MTRTFLRSFILFFLVLVLIVNLMYFFKLNEVLPIIQNIGEIDLGDKYFGFSTLINLIRNSSNKFTFIKDYQSWVASIGAFATDSLYGDWVDFINVGGIHDFESFFMAWGLFMQSIAGIVEYIFYFFNTIYLLVLNIVNFILMAFYLMFSGAFASLPETYGSWITLCIK